MNTSRENPNSNDENPVIPTVRRSQRILNTTTVQETSDDPDEPIAARTRLQQRLRRSEATASSIDRSSRRRQRRRRIAPQAAPPNTDGLNSIFDRMANVRLSLLRHRISRIFESGHYQGVLSSPERLAFRFLNALQPFFSWNDEDNVATSAPRPRQPLDIAAMRSTAEVSDPLTAFKCAICLDPYETNHPVATKCGHVYCYNCLGQWLAIARDCPKCKAYVELSSLRLIYP